MVFICARPYFDWELGDHKDVDPFFLEFSFDRILCQFVVFESNVASESVEPRIHSPELKVLVIKSISNVAAYLQRVIAGYIS